MATECVKNDPTIKLYEECIHLAGQYGKFFTEPERDAKLVYGNACTPTVLDLDAHPVLASLKLVDITRQGKTRRNQVILSWRPVSAGDQIQEQARLFCGGRTNQGDYKFVIKNGEDEEPRLPSEEEMKDVAAVIDQLGRHYRRTHSWWKRLLAKATHHNGKEKS